MAGKNMSTTTTTRGRKEATRVQIPSSLCFQTRSKRRRKTEEAASPLLLLPRLLEDFVEAAVSRAKTTTNIYNQKLLFIIRTAFYSQKSLVSSFSEKKRSRDLTFFIPQRKNGLRLAPSDETPAQVEQDEA